MKVVALVSGGKDSCFSMHMCAVHGHQVVALANLLPPDSDTDELDSYMYQTVGHQLVAAYAACTGLPLYRRRIHGTSNSQSLAYSLTAGDEVEDLAVLLGYIKERHPDIQAVASGAIASDYQRLRVESVCSRLGLVSLGYLWHQPQDQLLSDMITNDIEAVLVKVAAIGLDPHKHLGKSIRQMQGHLRNLRDRFGCNVCGEGGEYETLTLDCPAFKYGRIVLDDWQVVLHSPDTIAPVGVLHPSAFHIQRKQPPAAVAAAAEEEEKASGASSGQPGAVVIEVPADWQPQSTAAANSSSGDAAGPAWDTAMQVTVSPSHIHIICSATANDTAPPAAAGAGCAAADTAAALGAALSHITAGLGGLGLTWRSSCFVHLYLADMSHFGAANEVYCRQLPQLNPPSRACVQVPLPQGCPVLLDVLFARPCDSAQAAGEAVGNHHQQQQPERRVLHVQSISSWAPSCIGPYSQATACNGLIYMAGQIPLDPASMNIILPPAATAAAATAGGTDCSSSASMAYTVAAQAWRTLCSCQAVAVAMRSCFATASLALTVYLSEACAAAGGREVVQAALEAVWADRRLLDSLNIPAAVLAAATAAADGADCSARGCSLTDQDESKAGSTAAAEATTAAVDIQDSDSGCDEDTEQQECVIDDYLKPPAVVSPLKPAVVYITVPALPRGALLEVQPVLKDLTVTPAAVSSSSCDEDDEEQQQQQHHQQQQQQAGIGDGHAQFAAAAVLQGESDGGSSGIQVCVTHDTSSSRWRRILVHLPQVAASSSSSSSSEGHTSQAATAGQLLATAVLQLQHMLQQASRARGAKQQQQGVPSERLSVCTLRCWYDSSVVGAHTARVTGKGAACWQNDMVDAVRKGLGGEHVAVQFVPVTQVASSMHACPCWGILEALAF